MVSCFFLIQVDKLLNAPRIYVASRSDNEDGTVRISTQCVFRENSEIQPTFSRPPERHSPMRIHGLRLVWPAS